MRTLNFGSKSLFHIDWMQEILARTRIARHEQAERPSIAACDALEPNVRLFADCHVPKKTSHSGKRGIGGMLPIPASQLCSAQCRTRRSVVGSVILIPAACRAWVPHRVVHRRAAGRAPRVELAPVFSGTRLHRGEGAALKTRNRVSTRVLAVGTCHAFAARMCSMRLDCVRRQTVSGRIRVSPKDGAGIVLAALSTMRLWPLSAPCTRHVFWRRAKKSVCGSPGRGRTGAGALSTRRRDGSRSGALSTRRRERFGAGACWTGHGVAVDGAVERVVDRRFHAAAAPVLEVRVGAALHIRHVFILRP